MNLVVLYGPPAVGKLTVATELAALTGYKLFHNHLTQDLAKELYPEFGETRFKLVDKIRTVVIGYAAEHGTDLIFTFVYSDSEEDAAYVKDISAIVESAGGNIRFVELTASHEIILGRIDNPSRSKFRKLTNREIAKEKLSNGHWQSSVDRPNVLKIDTSDLDPKDSAARIAQHFGLLAQ